MKYFTLTILLFQTFLVLNAQGWQKSYDKNLHDYGSSVIQTYDEGFIVIGESNAFTYSDEDILIIKTDAAGDTLWTRSFGGQGYELGMSIQQTSDSGYLAVGYTQPFGVNNGDVYLIKLNKNGDSIWTHTYGSANSFEIGNDIIKTSNGEFLITGGIESKTLLIKTDSNGDTLWTKSYKVSDPLDNENGVVIANSLDGGFLIGGFIDPFSIGNDDSYLLKVNQQGDSVWSITMDSFRDVKQKGNDHLVLNKASLGYTLSLIDSSGNITWSNSILTDTVLRSLYSMQLTSDNGIVMTGQAYNSNGFYSTTLIKTDSVGQLIWSREFDPFSFGNDVENTLDGGFIIAGYNTPSQFRDVYLIKTDVNGKISGLDSNVLSREKKLIKTVDVLGRQVTPKPNMLLIEIYSDGSTRKRVILEK